MRDVETVLRSVIDSIRLEMKRVPSYAPTMREWERNDGVSEGLYIALQQVQAEWRSLIKEW